MATINREAFGLYLILTDPLVGYEACARAAVAAGVRYLQLRIKHRPDSDILPIAREVRRITAGSSTRFIVNDSVAVARAVDADGVHLGQDDMPLDEARRLWPVPGKLFGLSTHSEEQALAATSLDPPPDYIGVGPVHATPTKDKPDPVLGEVRAGAIIRSSPLTTVAIGGIDPDNLPSLLAAGAINFAVVRYVNRSPRPQQAIAELQSMWKERYMGPA